MDVRGLEVEPRVLVHFLALAEHGDVAATAASLRVTPRVLMRAVRELERRAAEPLFRPSGRKLVLTPVGRSTSASARKVLVALDRFRAATEIDGDTLRVAHVAAADTLAAVLDDLVADGTEVSLEEGAASDDLQLAELQQHRLDIAVCCARHDVPGIVTEPLRLDPPTLLAAPPGARDPARRPVVAPRYASRWTAHDVAVAEWERRNLRAIDWIEVPHGTGRDLGVLLRQAGDREVLVARSTVPAGCLRASVAAAPTPPALSWQLAWRADDDRPVMRQTLDGARATAERHGWLTAAAT